MASLKPFNLPPKPVCIHVFLAVASSFVWLSAFAIQISHPHTKTPHLRLLPAALFAAYLIHLLVALCLPICSRPWLWKTESKRSLNFLEIYMFAMGWIDNDGEHWAISGTRGVIAFAVALSPFFLLPIEKSDWGVAAIVALAAESFFLAETVKHTEMEEGVFFAMMSGAVCATRRLFGYSSLQLFIVVVICLLFISFHFLLPFFDDEVVYVGPPPVEETTNTSTSNTVSRTKTLSQMLL